MLILFNILFSIGVAILILFVLNRLLGFNLIVSAREGFENLINTLADHNTKKYVDRVKKSKIKKENQNLIAKYNSIVDGLIRDFGLPLTLEGFNSMVCIIFTILVLAILVVLQSVTLSVLVAISLIVGLITYFTMKSRIMQAAKLESIMDAEDLICPLARDGVLVAIKKVLESEEYIDRNIRPYFIQFVDNCENYGYSFRRAMEILNRQLGPKFDGFAKKAISFEYNERKGMADIFLDIVDENAALREINVRKNRIFKKMNFDFILKTLLVVGFVAYSMTNRDIREFLMTSDIGRLVNSVAVISICLSFARCQALQGDIGTFGGSK